VLVEAEAEPSVPSSGWFTKATCFERHVQARGCYRSLAAGAELVNDISGLTLGTGAAEAAGRAGAGYVLNYSYSVPKRRPDAPPVYADVTAETVAWMEQRLAELAAAGLAREAIAIDPGIAFGKSHDEDIQSLRRIGELTTFGQPVAAGPRKNFIGTTLSRPASAT
jgi:dihydropteroate synthase